VAEEAEEDEETPPVIHQDDLVSFTPNQAIDGIHAFCLIGYSESYLSEMVPQINIEDAKQGNDREQTVARIQAPKTPIPSTKPISVTNHDYQH